MSAVSVHEIMMDLIRYDSHFVPAANFKKLAQLPLYEQKAYEARKYEETK